MVERLERLFPGLRGKDYRITSPRDEGYNCVAWAAGVTTAWWRPVPSEAAHWPERVVREETLEAFREAFVGLGYVNSPGEELEPGYEKVAIFADTHGVPTHAARQLSNGRWTSKLGRAEDIEHCLRDLEGAAYGSVVLILKRPVVTIAPHVGADEEN